MSAWAEAATQVDLLFISFSNVEIAVTICAGANGFCNIKLFGTPFEA